MDWPCVSEHCYSVTIVDSFTGARAHTNDNGMVYNSLDLSYLGVHALWRHDLGKH